LGGALNLTKDTASTTISSINNYQRDGHNTNDLDYFADVILRVDNPKAAKLPEASFNHSRSELTTILVASTLSNELAPQYRRYLASIVANRNDITIADAEAKVDEVYSRITKAKEDSVMKAKLAADKAGKLATHTTLWLFVGLLLGAFIASLFATFGGRLRDDKKIYLT